MKSGFLSVLPLLLIGAASAFAEQTFFDPAGDSPDDAVAVKGRTLRQVALPGGKPGEISIAVKRMFPEFEKADLKIEVSDPGNRLETAAVWTVTLPGGYPAYRSGKSILSAPAKFMPGADGMKTAVIPLDIRTFKKSGTVPFHSRLESIILKCGKGDAKEAYVGKVTLEPKGVFCRFTAGNGEVYVYDLNKNAAAPSFTVFNEGSEAQVRFEFETTDLSGKKIDSGRIARKFKAGEHAVISLKKPVKAGVYSVNYSIAKEGADGFTHSRKIRFAAMHPAYRYPRLFTNDFLFSIVAHLYVYPMDEVVTMADYMALAGLNHSRTGSLWLFINPEPGVWRIKRCEKVIDILGKRGIEIQETVGYAPAWASDTDKKLAAFRYPKLDLYENYVREFVGKLKGRVRMFEDYNEVNLRKEFTPELYAAYEKAAQRGLRAGNPDAMLLSGSWGGVTSSWADEYYRKNPGIGDVVAVHYHTPAETSMYQIEATLDIIKKYSMKQKWFANECAFSTLDDSIEAENLFKKLFDAWANGSIGYTWYNLRNKGWASKPGEPTYGILTPDLCPRAAYVTYNMIAGVFRDAAFKGVQKVKGDATAYRFENRSQVMFPMWTLSRDYGKQTMLFRTDAKSAEAIDLYGNIIPVKIQGGVLSFDISSEPCVLRMTPANAKLDVIAPMLGTERKLVLTPGKKGMFKFEVSNPFASDKTFEVKVNCPEGVSAVPNTFRIAVGAGKKGAFETELSAAGNFSATKEGQRLVFSAKTTGLSGTCELLVQPILVIPEKSKKGDRGYVSLSCTKRSQFVSMADIFGLPNADHLRWGGTLDLSVYNAVFYPTKYELILQIFVTDDIHNQPFKGEKMFFGDSLQMMFLFPNQNGQWEIGASLGNDGKTETYIWMAPSGFNKEEVAKQIRLRTTKTLKNQTMYSVVIPLKSIGVTFDDLKKNGFRYNVLVNDNDGKERKGHMSITSANSTDQAKDAKNFPILFLE